MSEDNKLRKMQNTIQYPVPIPDRLKEKSDWLLVNISRETTFLHAVTSLFNFWAEVLMRKKRISIIFS